MTDAHDREISRYIRCATQRPRRGPSVRVCETGYSRGRIYLTNNGRGH